MLAQHYLPSAALNVSECERVALIGVLGRLERGELRYARRSAENGFNMLRFDCGTTHCIIGWATLDAGEDSFRGLRPFGLFKRKRGIDRLCYPNTSCNYQNISTEEAASALRNFLTFGEPEWASVLHR